MATSKTLAPTNVTISIPAMTDQPNASVLANCADKEADAINALNSQIGDIQYVYKGGLGHIEGETLIDKFRRAYEANTFPVGNGKPFFGYISAGSQCLVAGFLYMSNNQLYGCGMIGAYNGFKLIKISAGTFSDALA